MIRARLQGSVLALQAGIVLLAVGGVPAGAQPSDAHVSSKRAARAAATAWLGQLAEGAFEDGWEAAGAPLRERIKRETWIQRIGRAVDSLGRVSARTLSASTYHDSLRGTTGTGPAVVLTYRSTFAAGVVEELLLLTQDGKRWRVSGYRITPLRVPAAPRRRSLRTEPDS